MVRFTVMYVDDFGRKHLTFVASLVEIHFLKDRFSEVQIVEVVKISE